MVYVLRFVASKFADPRMRVVPLALLVAGAIIWPQFRTDYWAFVACQALIWALMALSLSILIGWTGEVSLAHAAFLGMGAYVAGKVGATAPFPVDILAGIAVGLPLSLLLGIPALRLRGLNLMVATAAFMLVMQSVVFQRLVGGGANSVLVISRPDVLGLEFSGDRSFYYFVLLAVGTCFFLTWVASKTMIRRAFVAMGDNPIAFGALGGNIVAHKLLVFALSGLAASLAGVLWGMLNRHVSSGSLTVNQSVFFLTLAVVGGRGSMVGALLAGVLFGIMPEVLRSIPKIVEYTYLLSGVGLILLLLQAPGGLASIPAEMRRMFAKQGNRDGAPTSSHASSDSRDATHRTLGYLNEVLSPPKSSASAAPLLTIERVDLRFGGVTALSDVSLGVASNSIVGLIGPNGAGKTSLLNCIGGFNRPQSGKVFFGDQEITNWPVSRRALAGIGRTFQTPKLFTNLSVEENVLVAVALHGERALRGASEGGARPVRSSMMPLRLEEMRPPLPSDHASAHTLLSLVGLEGSPERLASELSHAEGRSLELARALASSPSLLLLDEPVAGMDEAESDAFGELLKGVHQTLGVTIIVVEHDMNWVMGLCHKLFVLDFGLLLASGTPEEVRENEEVIDAYLGRGISHVAG